MKMRVRLKVLCLFLQPLLPCKMKMSRKRRKRKISETSLLVCRTWKSANLNLLHQATLRIKTLWMVSNKISLKRFSWWLAQVSQSLQVSQISERPVQAFTTTFRSTIYQILQRFSKSATSGKIPKHSISGPITWTSISLMQRLLIISSRCCKIREYCGRIWLKT